jgi:hypothetical protein
MHLEPIHIPQLSYRADGREKQGLGQTQSGAAGTVPAARNVPPFSETGTSESPMRL